MKCTRCRREIVELVTVCSSCGTFLGYPNVFLAELPEEQQALDARYTEAIASAELRGASEKLQEFEESAKASSAVIAMSSERLCSLAVNQNELYSTYDQTVRAQIRRPAVVRNDQNRRAVEGKLWGSAAPEIRYAALSLNGRGLKSYGDCFVQLKEEFISHRASVLEQNSYNFVESLSVLADCPTGFRSNWKERYKVAVAKCGEEITAGTDRNEFGDILLVARDDRKDDRFVEVHIFGGFDFLAFESVIVTQMRRSKAERLNLKIAKRYAELGKVRWNDE